MTVLVPELILQVMAPGMVEDFYASHPEVIDQRRPTYDPVRDLLFFSLQINDVIADSVRYSSWPWRWRVTRSNQQCCSGKCWEEGFY